MGLFCNAVILNEPPEGALTGSERNPRVLVMTISFSPRWNHYSWSNSDTTVDEESERQLILEMIRNCDSEDIRRYASSMTGGNVYVRTGIHSSGAEPRDHIQVHLGLDREPWSNADYRPYTAHIIYNSSGNQPYEASLVSGLHSGNRRRR